MAFDPRPVVLDALPEPGRLVFVRDIAARTGLTYGRIHEALRDLVAEGLVVHRPPFDVGRPDRYGRTAPPSTTERRDA